MAVVPSHLQEKISEVGFLGFAETVLALPENGITVTEQDVLNAFLFSPALISELVWNVINVWNIITRVSQLRPTDPGNGPLDSA